ncbi:putative quinol monooxygenase [Streptomyces sp. NPDC056296]|uniref:putative quinol monooxygenase n=1 Tax=Streptomyces sp. NPDC056296 TaxID=3345775 RepID=UPI0035D5D819
MNDTVMIIAESNAAEGKADQVRSLIESVVERTRAEDGCLRYELLRDLDDDSHIILIEEWRDQASLDAHLASEHLTTMFQTMMPLLAGEGHGTRVARIA